MLLYRNELKDIVAYYTSMETTIDSTNDYNGNTSPRSSLKSLQREVPKVKKRRRVTDSEYTILKPGQEHLLSERNYRVTQLKDMCRHYGQRVSGNKDELTKRLYNCLRLTKYAVFIQKAIRQIIVKRYIKARGPALIKRNLCVNEQDFLTMEEVSDIPFAQFISYQDSQGKVYGFNLVSLYNWYLKMGRKKVLNPYTREELPSTLKDNVRYILKMAKGFGDDVEVSLEEEEMDAERQSELRAVSLFQAMSECTQYIVDHTWLWTLGRMSLIRFIREVYDIWAYRAQLSDEVKRQICPPYGNPFRTVSVHSLQVRSLDELRTTSLEIISRMVTSTHDEGSRGLGANYVLCALTLVNETAAIQFPWLYQSVAQM